MAKQTTFETDKAKYVFQHPGLRFSDQMKDDAKDQNGKFMPHKYHKEVMDKVIVEPGVSYDYFDELEGDKKEVIKPNDTEYTLVYPGAKTLSEMQYLFTIGRGVPSEVNTKEQFMKHIVKVDGKPVSYALFDELGDIEEYNEVMVAAQDFFQDNEFFKVMNAARRFLSGGKI